MAGYLSLKDNYEKINVIAIAQGSSEFNISLVVAQGDADKAVQIIHKEFELEKPG